MTHHAQYFMPSADPGGEFAQLQRVHLLVGEMAGHEAGDAALDDAARIAAAYAVALPIAQRRFDSLAAGTAASAAAGLKALVTLQERGRPTRAAAARLAAALTSALGRLGAIIGA